MTEKFKKSAVASAIAIPLPLCFSCFVLLCRFRENLTKPFYFYLSRTCDSPGGTPSVISLALRRCETLWSAREIASMAPSAEQARHAENEFHIALRRCETLWSAREIASMALSAEQVRHTENVFHIALTTRFYGYYYFILLCLARNVPARDRSVLDPCENYISPFSL